MTLAVGSISVNYPSADSGSGCAWALYQAQVAGVTLLNTSTPPATWTGTGAQWTTFAQGANLATLQGLASFCTSLASGLIPYLTGNAVVTANISTSLGGLQTSTAANSATNPPATAKTIPGTLS